MLDRCGLEWYRVAGGRRDDGRARRARVHGAVRGRRERRRARRRGTPPTSRSPAPTPSRSSLPPPLSAPEEVPTPGMTTIDAVARELGVDAGALLKAYPVIVDDDAMKVVVLRGDHRVNEIKLRAALAGDFRPARPRRSPTGSDRRGSSARSARSCRSCSTRASPPGGYVMAPTAPTRTCAGSSRAGTSGYETVDVRTVARGRHGQRLGDPDRARDRGRQHLQARDPLLRAARRHLPRRVGQIQQLMWMGCYGFGPARAAAAAVEQYADEHGISWPRSIAPFDVEIVALGKEGSEERPSADRLYAELRDARAADAVRRSRRRTGREVRRRRAARLPGAGDGRPPHACRRRDRGPDAPRPRDADGAARGRGGGGGGALAGASLSPGSCPESDHEAPPVRDRPIRPAARSDALEPAAESVDDSRTRSASLRLAGIPVFLAVALSSDDGHDALAVVLFAVIGWADYLDGFVARLTGQYSRLGALLDPIVDRLLVISGMVVAGTSACCRGGRSRWWSRASCSCSALSRYGLSPRQSSSRSTGPAGSGSRRRWARRSSRWRASTGWRW